jgi:hypothetical protein
VLADLIAWLAVIDVAITATGLLISRDWRWDLGLLATQYAGVAVLVAQHLPLGMAAAKLVTGWMVTAALGMTLTGLPRRLEEGEQIWPEGRAFRLFLVGMILLLAAAVTPRMENALGGIGASAIAGTIVLSGIGLLQLGTSSQIDHIIFGLLTVLGGFEILYSSVEGSILVAGLLAMVTLGLGLVGAYLLNAFAQEELT